MVKRVLVTTALEDTWPEDEPVLFLGEWCRLYSRKARWSAMDYEVLSYHWDDRKKLTADFQVLRECVGWVLTDLADQLNRLHGVDHSLRYWRILIGPWLNCFVHSLFDRWTTVHQAVDDYDLSSTIVLGDSRSYRAPENMADFETRILSDVENQWIYADILEKFTKVPCIRRPLHIVPQKQEPVPVRTWKHKVRRILGDTYMRVASMLARDGDMFLISTYLPVRDEKKVYLRLGQMPLHWRSVKPDAVAFDANQRNWAVPGKSSSELENCVRTLISKYIPITYLEGYDGLVEMARKQRLPTHPKLIWTSMAHIHDEVLKTWIAEKVDQGSRLAIGQHGGHFGMGLCAAGEDHDKAIADGFLSWGWSEPWSPQVKPVGMLKVRQPLDVCHAEQDHLLLITKLIPRYSYRVNSAMISRQWLDCFQDNCHFIECLPPHIKSALIVRLYHSSIDYGWSEEERWRERFSDLNLEDGKGSLDSLIRQSRIMISTYNSTTFLESLAMNVPTVIYWNPNHWELRERAVPYFETLERAGVFHKDPTSAARHVAKIWDDVDAWWSSVPVREAVAQFSEQFLQVPKDLLGNITQALQGISESRGKENGS